MATPKKPAAPTATDIPTETATATPPAAETPKTAAEAAPTPEEIEAAANDLMASAFGAVSSGVNARIQEEREDGSDQPESETPTDVPADPDALPQDGAPEGGDKERSEPAKPAEETAPANPAEERFVPGAMTPADVEETARRAAREEIESMEPTPAPADNVPHGTPDDESLPYALKKHLKVLSEMADQNPAYKDLPERQRAFWKKDEQYRAKWQQANPGSVFNPDESEHAEFYRKNEPFVPQDVFDEAKESLIARRAKELAKEEFRKEQEPRLRAVELREREREAAPLIANSMADAAEAVFSAAPQFKEAFKPKELTKAAMEKMEEINPALARVAREEAEKAAVLVSELEKLDRLQGHYAVDPNKRHELTNGEVIAPHALLEHEFSRCEQELLKKPEAERVRDGKKMISFEEAAIRAERINLDPKLKPEQRARAMENLTKSFWWVQSADVRKHIVAKSQARVGQFAEAFTKMPTSPASTTATNGTGARAPQTAPPKPQNTQQRQGGKAGLARGTDTSSSSDVSDNAPKGRNEVEKNRENLEKMAFR